MFGHYAATSRAIFTATLATWLVVGSTLAWLIAYALWSLLELAIADPWEFAYEVSWRLAVLFAAWCITEHQMHVWILHSKRIVKFVYQWHHVEHHGMRQNDLIPHVDNDWLAYIGPIVAWPVFVYRGIFVEPYALVTVLGLLVTVPLHMYFWNHVHRAIHRNKNGMRLEYNWMLRWRWFDILERHHLQHHAKPNCNYSVVFAPYTDWLLGTLHGQNHFVRRNVLIWGSFLIGFLFLFRWKL